jgi:hypothetical protein
MNRIGRIMLLGAFSLTVAWVELATTADAGSPVRPFKGGGVGELVSQTEVAPGVFDLVVMFQGQATQIGKYVRRDELRVDFTTGSVVGTKTFRAANGDTINVTTAGWIEAPSVPGGLFRISGTYTFTGGTGRFAKAAGTANYVVLTPDFIRGALSFEGRIQY